MNSLRGKMLAVFSRGMPAVVGLFLVGALTFVGCASDKDIVYLNDRMLTIDKKVNQLQSKIEGEHSGDMQSLRVAQADMLTDLSSARSELQQLRGMVEENSQLLRRGTLGGADSRASSMIGIEDMQRRVLALEAGLRQIQEYLKLEPTASQDESPSPAAQNGPVVAADVVVAAPSAPEPVSADKALYDKALADYRAGNYQKAVNGFGALLNEHPKSALADNAQFWIGESHMALKQYEQAILAYQKVIKDYPKGNKVPSAMLRQALAFQEIDDKTSSRLLLRQIIKQFPDSPEAKIAKSKLENLN